MKYLQSRFSKAAITKLNENYKFETTAIAKCSSGTCLTIIR